MKLKELKKNPILYLCSPFDHSATPKNSVGRAVLVLARLTTKTTKVSFSLLFFIFFLPLLYGC